MIWVLVIFAALIATTTIVVVLAAAVLAGRADRHLDRLRREREEGTWTTGS